ncbi:tyrosine-type recombinase/integrase [Boseongicola aestuarii]|uniref:Site-specific tyrosine recombinase XerC n=1 Tax=Boseongicola aestuarii TaxID=1470561 RepID=A0A238J2J5_9RHOB|nr:tyrosine-type recombinase/integrase [Boseongicola aestuarii]SMX24886.1 site-specific tyrosine recombinase XerC [Boseongicola aestuarii]
MDQAMPLKLPRYMFRRANGSFRYKRNVPKDLRKVISKATVYRQLGNTYQDALRALPKVHADIEALFDRERRTTDEQRARELVRERLGERHQSMFIEGAVDPEWPEYDDFQDLAEDVEHAVPKGVTQQIRAATSKAAPMSLSRVLDEYYAYKAEDADNGLGTRLDRIRKDLILSLGKNRYEWTELQDLTRADANTYRDVLLARMSPNSVQRNLGVVKAAINHALLEHDLDFRNVFQAIKIKGAGSSSTDRLPITDEQLTLMGPAFASNDTAKALLLLLTDTGARLAEITGLEAKDVDLDNAILHIRPNDRRGLKTKTSSRSIPLSQRAAECLREHQVGLSDTDPIFPAYAKPRGNDSASAMLMKRLRTVIADKKITMHSLRHRMKDKLRNSGCPEHLSMAILGHSANTVAANYGSGYAIDVMREALERVWVE